MSLVAVAIDRCERFGDRFNAILVKEVRQALKSRQFVVTFMLFLLVSWAGSLYGVAYLGDSIEYGSPAQTFFAGFYLGLCIAALVIVPFSAFRSIVEERSENTLELMQITSLSPRQIVWGKSLSALVQVLVFYCAITPFIAFTALLPGFDFPRVIFSLVMLFIASLTFSMIALATGSQARQKLSQAFSSLAVVGMCIGGSLGFYSFMMAASGEIPFDTAETWWVLSFVLFVVLSTAFLCQQVTVAQLTFESDNRSSGMRVTILAQWLVCWIGGLVFVGRYPSRFDLRLWLALFTVSMIYVFGAGLFFVCESDLLSRRISRDLPRSRILRLVSIPFLPGGTRGLLYALLSIGGIVLLSMNMAWKYGHAHMPGLSQEVANRYVFGLVCYLVIVLGVSAFLGRFLRRIMRNVKAGHVLALLTVIFLVLIVVGAAARFLLDLDQRSLLLIDAVNPFYTLGSITEVPERPGTTFVLDALGVIALLVMAGNIRWIIRVSVEVLNNPVRRLLEERERAARASEAANLPIPDSP